MKSPERENSKEDKVMAALQCTLKESVEKNRANEEQLTGTLLGSQNQQWHRRPLGCTNCQAKGRGESCDHCHI